MTDTRPRGAARPTSTATTPTSVHAPPAVTPRPAAADRRPHLTAGDVVRRGAVVGLDDSATVRALLPQVVAANPGLIGTASLATLLSATGSGPARTGRLRVRLFGGAHDAGGVFTGAQGVKAVTATRCDVAVIAGCVVGDEVWVSDTVWPGRLALLLAAGAAYLVPEPIDAHWVGPSWAKLAYTHQFDGVLESPSPPAERAAA